MKIVNSSAELIKQESGIKGLYKQVEFAARNCYQSFDKTTENSYEKLINHLGSNGHMSPFAHGTVYLKFPINDGGMKYNRIQEYDNNFWSRVVIENGHTHGVPSDAGYYVTTNMRVIKENGWEDDLQYWCEPTEFHHKRITVKVICSIGISREMNRHATVLSIAEESTRYCNYSKDKFGSDITFVRPEWVKEKIEKYGKDLSVVVWEDTMQRNEDAYMTIMNHNEMKPQFARELLPLSTKTTVIYTAYEDDWKEVLNKRTTPACHPDMIVLANKIKELIF